jgi:hypothetical protein
MWLASTARQVRSECWGGQTTVRGCRLFPLTPQAKLLWLRFPEDPFSPPLLIGGEEKPLYNWGRQKRQLLETGYEDTCGLQRIHNQSHTWPFFSKLQQFWPMSEVKYSN